MYSSLVFIFHGPQHKHMVTTIYLQERLGSGVSSWVAVKTDSSTARQKRTAVSAILPGITIAILLLVSVCLVYLSFWLVFHGFTFYFYSMFSYFMCFIFKLHISQFSCSVVSDSLWPHESQHARPPCPSATARVHSDSRPSSQWCHPAISSSVVPFSCPKTLPASESMLLLLSCFSRVRLCATP